MEATVPVESVSAASRNGAAAPGGFEGLGGDAFFKLLIAQLANQDPLEPTSNQELLQQISSIRDIELSTALTRSLKTLVDQQRLGSGAALIGQYVSGSPGASGEGTPGAAGVVLGIRFMGDGAAVLLLDNGGELPLDQVQSVMPARQAAQRLIGQMVTGLDRSDPNNPVLVEGIVTGVRGDSGNDITLELDSGGTLRLSDFVAASPIEGTDTQATESEGTSEI